MDFQPLDTSLRQKSVEVVKVPHSVDDIRTQIQEYKTILFRDNSDYSSIQNSETLKESNTLPKANSNLNGEILSFDSTRDSEITTEETKHPTSITNDVFVNIHCGDSIQYLMATERPKTCTKPSDSIVPEDNPSTAPIQGLITTIENSNSSHKKTNDSIPAGNPSTEPKTLSKTNDSIPAGNPSTEPKTLSKTNDSIPAGNPSTEPKTLSKTNDSIPAGNPSTEPKTLSKTNDSIPAGNPSTEPKTLSKTNDSIPAGNPSTEPKTLSKTNDSIPAGNPSTEPKTLSKTNDSIPAGNPSTEPKTLSKTNDSIPERFPFTEPKTLSKISGDSLRSERIQTNNIPTKDNYVFTWIPVCEIKQQSSRLRNTQSSEVSHYTSDRLSQCKQLQNKQHSVYLNTALRKHTDLCLDRRRHIFSRPFTKKELELALPRKSYFNCHEKALKEAAFEVNATATDELLTKPDNRRGTPATESLYSEFRTDIKIVIMGRSDKDISKKEKTESETDELFNKPNNMVTLEVPEVDKMAGKASGPTKLLPHTMKTKRPGTSKMEHLECKPLRKYLEYVKENEQEYLQFEQTSKMNTAEQQPGSSSLLKIGRAFELRNHGGKMRSRDEPLVIATRALRPRTADFDKFNKYRDTDIWFTDPSNNMLKQQNRRNPDKNAQGMVAMPTVNTDVNPKSELEKLKQKAEEWCRSVPTNTVLKAKLWSLKELGICDMEVTDWSQAFKNCGYIRQVRP